MLYPFRGHPYLFFHIHIVDAAKGSLLASTALGSRPQFGAYFGRLLSRFVLFYCIHMINERAAIIPSIHSCDPASAAQDRSRCFNRYYLYSWKNWRVSRLDGDVTIYVLLREGTSLTVSEMGGDLFRPRSVNRSTSCRHFSFSISPAWSYLHFFLTVHRPSEF